MADHESKPSTEAMAFQLILHKLGTLERQLQAIPPLLEQMVTCLEGQTKVAEVAVATYEHLYPALQDKTAEAPDKTTEVAPTPPRRRVWQWFMRR